MILHFKNENMKIIKRDGKEEEFKIDKILKRIEKQTFKLSTFVDSDKVAVKVIAGCYDGITTTELDNLACETAASLIPEHPDYSLLASRLSITTLHKNVKKNFSDSIGKLYNYVNSKTNEEAGLISKETYDIIMKNTHRGRQSIYLVTHLFTMSCECLGCQ